MGLTRPVADALSGLSDRLLQIERDIAELKGDEDIKELPNVRPLRRRKGHDPTGG